MRPRLSCLLPLLALAACSSGTGQRRDDTAVVVSAIGASSALADPDAGPLDPARRALLGATAQGLVRFDAAGQIEPGLAERWIVIDDGRSYIFRLRDDATWPDGTPVTAEEVVRTLRRVIAPRTHNELAPFLAVIDEIVEMTPQVIEVRLKRPRPDLLKLFAQPEMAVFRTGKLDGSGPFRASARGNGIVLRPVPQPGDGEDGAAPRPQETLFFRGERAAVAVTRFREGRSDLVLGGSFVDWPLIEATGIARPNVRIDATSGLFGLLVVSRSGFLADTANRAAIAMAIDRPMVTHQVHPDWAPTETLLPAQLDSAAPPAQPGWAPLDLGQRRQNARAAVAAWKRAHPGPVTLRLALPAGPGATLVWARLAEALYAIGITPVRVGIDDPAELKLIDAVAPYDSARWFVASACQPCSGDAQLLVEAGRDAPDLDARAQRIAEADAALTADVAYIPIAQPFRWSIVALRLQAWQGNARAWHPLNHLRNETR
ncbi:ABC transporter substrate-binding protein [Sphingomonas sp. HITSZ_GF]|uniref:ABC transporter substrate-binding protein n=1 Tax=Sphingomonas sp. HITSZ_GF TaxID=3037247 RepID=UPI00240D3954|nr:ABC transporter substrate-binding protein [Sphingomonas sp. HITSZ_GF]MDG2534827.1 ABC transporter substrate-binding protein [Sphingomonas sp. HITSZ_GF]